MTEPDPDSAPDNTPVGERLRDAAKRARAGVETARQKATDVVETTRARGEAVIEDTREKTYRAAAETNRLFQEHPIAAVAAAAAAGAVIGIFLPRLGLAAKAGQIAGKAARAAVASDAARALVKGGGGIGAATARAAIKSATSALIRKAPDKATKLADQAMDVAKTDDD